MSLLTICQRVVDEVGLDERPSAIAASTDQLARQLLAVANATLEELVNDHDWPVLRRSGTISTVIGQTEYSLPSDILRQVRDTSRYDADNAPLAGSETSAEMSRPYNVVSTLYGHRFQLKLYPLKLVVDPVPDVVTDITFEYITNKAVLEIDGTTYTSLFMVDSDVPLISERIVRMGVKWRIKHAKGMDYAEDFNAYEIARKQEYAQQLQLGNVPVSHRIQAELPEPYVPTEGFG